MKTLGNLLLFMALGAGAVAADWSKSWGPNGWSGYQPLAAHEQVDGVLHIYDAKAQYGFGWRSGQKLPAAAGDDVVITARVRGRGEIHFQLQYEGADGKWLGIGPQMDRMELTDAWQERQFRLPVGNLKEGVTAAVMPTFAGRKNTELFIADIVCEVQKGEFAGDASFPKHWTVFAPVPPGAPEPPVDRIPPAIADGKPVIMTLNNNRLEVKHLFPEQRKGNCAWLYAEMDSDHSQDYTIGAGADYFMAVHLNGQLILDTRKSGNGNYPPHFSNHTATVKLQKGKNLLAVQFLTGSSVNPAISLGGVRELRELETVVRIQDVFAQDDYDSVRERRGNPELIEDILVDGMETTCRFGLYRAGASIGFDALHTLPAKSGDALFATGVRLQKLTGDGDLVVRLGKAWALRLSQKSTGDSIRVAFCHQGKPLKYLDCPRTALPLDIVLAVSHREYFVNLVSVQDSRLRALRGHADFSDLGEFATDIALDGVDAVVKSYFTGLALREAKSSTVPFAIALDRDFDPVAAGWKLAWQDEFDGREVDWESTWMNSPWAPAPKNRDQASLRDGRLHIRCDWTSTPEAAQPYTGRTVGLYSQRRFLYGYFEAKVRFTRKPGWWAAFWMFDEGRNMSVGGGYELDIFEDYSTRGGEPVIANNLHVTYGPNMRSYGYHFALPGTLDDFYVVGCKWTPFEFSTYINGRLVASKAQHSPYPSATYDAINHGFGTAPLYLCLSGQAGRSGGLAKQEGSEEFVVEYVRAYEFPRDRTPILKMIRTPERSTVKTGGRVVFEAEAASSPKSQSPVRTAYLFDNGNLVDYRTEPPYRFEIALSPAFYQDTVWGSSGRSGQKPVWDSYPHLFRVAVQDEAGQVAFTEPFPVIVDHQSGEPWQGGGAPVPGAMAPGQYNRGGHNIACYKQLRGGIETGEEDVFNRGELNLREAGEWVNYTLDVQTAGAYRIVMRRRDYRKEWPARGMVLVDGVYVGDLQAGPQAMSATLERVRLGAGRHVLTLVSVCTYGLWPASLDVVLDKQTTGGARRRRAEDAGE